MVILIGGESHTGKTLMAQALLEQYHYPYTSLDHIKMGLVRSGGACGFTAEDGDERIADKLWGIVRGIIDTCLENRQHIILEGCYLPPEKVVPLLGCGEVAAVYLIFSRGYIEKHFDNILSFENAIERRKYPETRTKKTFIEANARLKERCVAAGAPFFEIQSDYESELQEVYAFIGRQLQEKRSG